MRHSRVLVVAGLSLLFAGVLAGACGGSDDVAPSGSDWPTFGHDLQHTRSNPTENTIGVDNVADLELVWEHRGVEVSSTPSIVDGVVYFADWSGLLYARKAIDGSEVWTSDNGGIGITASLAVGPDTIFIGDRQAVLHSIDRDTGEFRWSAQLDAHPSANLTGSPIPVDDIVIVGVSSGELGSEKEDYTFRGSIVAVGQSDGVERWRVYVSQDDETSGAGVSVWSTPSIDIERQLMFIGTGQSYEQPAGPMSDSLIAIDYVTGEVAWVRQYTENDVYRLFMPIPKGPDADIGAAPNLFRIGGRDVVGVGDKGGVYAVFDRATGEPVWRTKLGPGSHLGGIMAPAAYAEGTLFVATNLWPSGFDSSIAFVPDFDLPENTSELIALDATDGSELWRTPVSSPTIGGAMHANGVVYSGHTLGMAQAFDASDGRVLWQDRVGDTLASGQVVSDGMLFVTHGFSFIGITGAGSGFTGGLRAYALPE
ncbi:MAG: PQQ-binding-like beta-propeller repeat protein [Polyangiales bacterium]